MAAGLNWDAGLNWNAALDLGAAPAEAECAAFFTIIVLLNGTMRAVCYS